VHQILGGGAGLGDAGLGAGLGSSLGGGLGGSLGGGLGGFGGGGGLSSLPGMDSSQPLAGFDTAALAALAGGHRCVCDVCVHACLCACIHDRRANVWSCLCAAPMLADR